MRIRHLLTTAAAMAILPGCLGDSTGPAAPNCETIQPQQASVAGDTITTTTGLRYITTSEGSGVTAESCRQVAVHYTGYLTNGSQFDTSRDGNPFVFVPGIRNVIRGFEQGVVGMKVGGTRRLIIPPGLAYGSQPRINPQTGEEVIPANSTLIFDVELVAAAQR
jgi:FKBP-type peptidyl-prolyl cis-trans isomerase FkpA